MKKVKNYIKSIVKLYQEAIIIYLIIPITIFIVGLIYGLYNLNNMENFINQKGYYFAFATIIIYIIFLIKKYKIKGKKININIYPYLLLSLSTAVFLNGIIFLMGKNNETSNNTVTIILGSVIIGPIAEEIVYRYILLKKLNKKYAIYKSCLITTIIFALSHNSIINIIYAFIMGTVFIITYLKNKNIKESILSHMIANFVVIFIIKFEPIIFILSIISIIISCLIIQNKHKLSK